MRKIHEITAVRLACERATARRISTGCARASSPPPMDNDGSETSRSTSRRTAPSILEIVQRHPELDLPPHRAQVYYLMTVDRPRIYFNGPARCRTLCEEHLAIFRAASPGAMP